MFQISLEQSRILQPHIPFGESEININPATLILSSWHLLLNSSIHLVYIILSSMEKEKPHFEHCKITVIGNVDSGKSTLVGVLTKAIPDDGRGSARLRVFNYPHEIQTGRTSSICHEIMGFDQKGDQVVPERFQMNKNKYWKQVVATSKKITTFFDLCGHEKYLKTTINGLTGLVPDYSMIIVGSNMGISKMTREHLGISLFLKIPFMIILTKIDIAPANIYQETITTLQKILKSKLVEKMPLLIKEGTPKEEILKYTELMPTNKICPIFSISSVTGTGMKELIYFLSKLNNRDQVNNLIRSPESLFEFDTNETFIVEGVGLVVAGIVKSGTARINMQCLLGPDKAKGFRTVVIKSIHVNRSVRDEAISGEYACFNIRPLKAGEKLTRNDFRKGMVLLDINLKPEPVYEFEAEVQVLHHATTITPGYQSMLHCGSVRQSVNLKKIYQNEEQLLRNDDRGLVRFRFMYGPEYLKPGLTILLREGRTKILGTITKLFPEHELTEQDKLDNISLLKRDHKKKMQKGESVKSDYEKKVEMGQKQNEKKESIAKEEKIQKVEEVIGENEKVEVQKPKESN